MIKRLTLSLPIEEVKNDENLKTTLGIAAELPKNEPFDYLIHKKSIDARSRQIKINLEVSVFTPESKLATQIFEKKYPNVSDAKPVIIVGAGPAGMFAALRLIELGLKPILIERGKDVRERRRDLAAINKNHIVNGESNYCFGEGGAGTYSDGKLYTRSKKRGDINRILEILVSHGANPAILVEAHPHIGTNKLPQIVADLRNSIVQAGGVVLFNTKVTDFVLDKNSIKGVVTSNNETILGDGLILATDRKSVV